MRGLMQDWPLLTHTALDFAATQYGGREIVTRSIEGPIQRQTYARARGRALKTAQLLERAGVKIGDRVATLAWNTGRHVECWYGIMGIGAICHTVNPRLFPNQIAWIVNHAQDRLMFADTTFVPLLESLADKLPTIERYILLTDRAHMPQTKLRGAIAYEDWLQEADGDFQWRRFDEETAAGLCYTSGTTGDPKGVLYSHRSNILHAMQACMGNALGFSARDAILPIVPMFHANAWSTVFSGPLSGAKLVMPGAKLDGESIYHLLEDEKVTMSAAVPTVWLMLMHHLQQSGKKLNWLKRVAIGGSACPRAMLEYFEKECGVEVIHAWGMTEMSPIGALGIVKPAIADLQGEDFWRLKLKQGAPIYGVEMKIIDDDGLEVPHDGQKIGRLKVRGPCVAKHYFHREGEILDAQGYFDTGDIASIDPEGYMQIADRAKDLIKSGGEWISSIELENVAVGHPKVAEAAAIGVRHPKWDERPLLFVRPKPGETVDPADLIAFMGKSVAKWQLPDAVRVVEQLPHTSTGKINKAQLRLELKDFSFSDEN